jgi:hypothetical protein
MWAIVDLLMDRVKEARRRRSDDYSDLLELQVRKDADMPNPNISQKQFAPDDRLAHGQTLTLEEYRALQSAGKAPDTMKGDPDYAWVKPRRTAASENRREAKELLGLAPNDPQYGSASFS